MPGLKSDPARPISGIKENCVQLENLNIEQQEVLITPDQLKAKLPVSDELRDAISDYRDTVKNIVDRNKLLHNQYIQYHIKGLKNTVD